MNKEYIWDVVYDMNGIGLSEFLNDFTNSTLFHSTRYGEQIYIQGECYSTNSFFSGWLKWRAECSYYFNGLVDAIEETGEDFTDDEVIEILVFGICRTLGLFYDVPNEPEKYGRFLFC